MSILHGPLNELDELASALCDQEISCRQAARLEELVNSSEAAEQYFLEYVRLHAELCWEYSAQRDPPAFLAIAGVLKPAEGQFLSPATSAYPQKLSGKRRLWISAALALSLLVSSALGLIGYYHGGVFPRAPRNGISPPTYVARLGGTSAARWSEGGAPQQAGRLAAGDRLVLREGLAELLFDDGASVILEGPAEFEPQSAACGILSRGRLTAHATGRALGFTIRTPQATVSDLGTEFGVAAERGGRSGVEVFIGNVEVCPGRAGAGKRLRAGEAVQVVPVAAGLPHIVRVAAGSQSFVRSLPSQPPSAHSAARLRAIVALNPHLIHHYPFEGESLEERLCDRRGNLPLGELAMRDGRGGEAIDDAAAGFDATARALRPYRALHHGNTRGVALQSEAVFQPPKAMTVELLLSFADPGEGLEGAIFAAVATRASRRDCGFLVAALGRGQIAVLLDGRARWLESGFSMVPGDWYYLASTFDTEEGRTVVNCYVADLSAGQRTPRGVIRDQWVAGAPSAGPLGIGKGFDGEIAHAYPWSGALEGIAMYDAVLDGATLQSHLDALTKASPATARSQAKK